MKSVSHDELVSLPDYVLFQTVELKPLDGDTTLSFVFGCLCMKLPKRNANDRYFQYTKITEPEFKGIESEDDWKRYVGEITEKGLECPIMLGAVHNSLELTPGVSLVLWEIEDFQTLVGYLDKHAKTSKYYTA